MINKCIQVAGAWHWFSWCSLIFYQIQGTSSQSYIVTFECSSSHLRTKLQRTVMTAGASHGHRSPASNCEASIPMQGPERRSSGSLETTMFSKCFHLFHLYIAAIEMLYIYIWASIARYPPPHPMVMGLYSSAPVPPSPPVVWVVWVVVGGGGGRSCICMYMNVYVWYECIRLVFVYDCDMICIW